MGSEPVQVGSDAHFLNIPVVIGGLDGLATTVGNDGALVFELLFTQMGGMPAVAHEAGQGANHNHHEDQYGDLQGGPVGQQAGQFGNIKHQRGGGYQEQRGPAQAATYSPDGGQQECQPRKAAPHGFVAILGVVVDVKNMQFSPSLVEPDVLPVEFQ